jgi:FkbM family methyltransferase
MIDFIRTKLRRRPFPPNLRALRVCRVSYSQHGEDLFLTLLLGYEKTDGVYVDIGCFDPIFYSNTYVFYQRGWKGLAIDPNPGFQNAWRRYRPRDTFLNLAISKNRQTMAYIMSREHPATNMVVPEDQASSFDASQFEASVCEAVPLAEILNQHLIGNRIDLMSVDCEGMDLDVLQSNDWEKYRPRVLAAEDNSISLDSELSQFLRRLNYECQSHIGRTKIFQLQS